MLDPISLFWLLFAYVTIMAGVYIADWMGVNARCRGGGYWEAARVGGLVFAGGFVACLGAGRIAAANVWANPEQFAMIPVLSTLISFGVSGTYLGYKRYPIDSKRAAVIRSMHEQAVQAPAEKLGYALQVLWLIGWGLLMWRGSGSPLLAYLDWTLGLAGVALWVYGSGTRKAKWVP
jgi:hypothetical protein